MLSLNTVTVYTVCVCVCAVSTIKAVSNYCGNLLCDVHNVYVLFHYMECCLEFILAVWQIKKIVTSIMRNPKWHQLCEIPMALLTYTSKSEAHKPGHTYSNKHQELYLKLLSLHQV